MDFQATRLCWLAAILAFTSVDSSAQVFRKYSPSPQHLTCPPGVVCDHGVQSSYPVVVGQSYTVGPTYPVVGPTLAPQLPTGSPVTTSVLDRTDTKFRRVLMEAARRAKRSGAIGLNEFVTLSVASKNLRVLEKMQAVVEESAVEEGVIKAGGEGKIDWDSVIEFIEKLIPLLVQLIELFSWVTQHVWWLAA